MNDDSLTEENDSGMINRKDLALLRNLNDKELFANNVDPKQFNKRLDGYAIEDEDDLPGLKATSGSSIRKKNGRKRKGVKEDYDNNAHISSEEMMANNSRISNDSSALIVEKGLLKSQDKDKYRRDMETNKIMVEEGVIK